MKAALLLFLAIPALAEPAHPPLGVSVYGAYDGLKDFSARLAQLKKEGFTLVSLVPTYPYIGKDRIDMSGGPGLDRVEKAVALAESSGLTVVLKPHLDPGAYFSGYRPADPGVTRGWRWGCGWRGFFDVDPMSADYRAFVGGWLSALSRALARAPKGAAPVRLELGSELMDSVAAYPERWARLLDWAKKERTRLGLDGRVLLSYNFEHHFEIADDVVDRLTPYGRRELARFVRELDAVALSQYMDLTVAEPAAARAERLPTAEEVAEALSIHEKNFREKLLGAKLGIPAAKIPPLEIGEFGVGKSGLRRPNEWGETTPAQDRALAPQVVRALEGLELYLRKGTVGGAALWTVGKHFDVYGWDDPAAANPEAQKALSAYLK